MNVWIAWMDVWIIGMNVLVRAYIAPVEEKKNLLFA
jgi:hypothetical protein